MIFSTQPSGLEHQRSFSIDTATTAAGVLPIDPSNWRASLASSDDSTQRYSGDYGGVQVESDYLSISSGNPLKRSLEDSEDEHGNADSMMDYNSIDEVQMKDWILESIDETGSVEKKEAENKARGLDLSRRATIN